jgi:signal transduction histidine kinase
MPRLKLFFLVFAAAVIAPAGVLLRYGRRFVDAEERRLAKEAEAERARGIDAVRAEVEAALARVEAIEERRPWYHYRNHFVPPDLQANAIAFDRSPLYPRPVDPLVQSYFEWTPGSKRLATPAEGVAPADDDERQAAAEQLERVRALERAGILATLDGVYARRAALFPAPIAEEVTSKILVACHVNPAERLEEIGNAQKGDVPAQKKLAEEWNVHQAVQSKARKVFEDEKRNYYSKGQAQNPQAVQPFSQATNDNAKPLDPQGQVEVAQRVQQQEPLAATIRTFGIRYAYVDPPPGRPGGPADASAPAAAPLIALRLVDLDGTLVLQGYAVDSLQLWSLAEKALARLGLAGEVGLGFSPDAASPVALVPQGAARTAASAALAPSRAFLYGSALLLLFLATAGLAVLYGIVRGHMELARRRTDFVAAVSHELKAPLTAIRALAEMLSLGIVPTRAKEEEYFGHIRAESERLSRLIANVLDLARIERRERTYELVRGEAGEVVRALGETWRPHLATQGFRFEVEIAPDLPPARFDRDALEQAISNLLDNAAKYTAQCAEKRIALRARASGGARAEIVIEVEDSGIGISDEDRRRLFRRFVRGSAPLARGTGGAGLGLAIAKEHLDAHGGRLEVESAPGRGSRFRAILPAAR